eukprot:gene10996-biopygen8523
MDRSACLRTVEVALGDVRRCIIDPDAERPLPPILRPLNRLEHLARGRRRFFSSRPTQSKGGQARVVDVDVPRHDRQVAVCGPDGRLLGVAARRTTSERAADGRLPSRLDAIKPTFSTAERRRDSARRVSDRPILGGPVWLHPEDQEVILLRAEDRVLVLSVHRLRQEAHGGEGRERRSGEGKGLKALLKNEHSQRALRALEQPTVERGGGWSTHGALDGEPARLGRGWATEEPSQQWSPRGTLLQRLTRKRASSSYEKREHNHIYLVNYTGLARLRRGHGASPATLPTAQRQRQRATAITRCGEGSTLLRGLTDRLDRRQLFSPSTRQTRQASPHTDSTPHIRVTTATGTAPAIGVRPLPAPIPGNLCHFALNIALLVGLPPGGRSSCLRARPPLHRIGSDGPARGASATPMTG